MTDLKVGDYVRLKPFIQGIYQHIDVLQYNQYTRKVKRNEIFKIISIDDSSVYYSSKLEASDGFTFYLNETNLIKVSNIELLSMI